ncbi:hypothetical protein RB596_005172 [Gaeumannomyces avenae]
MDPISALGAASAVIGIAGFAIQLCEVLHKVSGEIKGAHDSLVAVVAIIESTAESLRLIHQYLDVESQNQQSGQQGGLFSKDALIFVKNNADRCLLVFWRIEAAVLDKSDKNLEGILRDRLVEFDSKARAHPGDLKLSPEPVPQSLSFLGRLRWPLVAPKLDEFRSQLQFHQQCLSLVFMVISLGEVRNKPTTSNQDVASMAKMAREIETASKEIKSIMKTVHSIRGMVKGGDINVGVLFGGPGSGKPAKRTDPRPARDHQDDLQNGPKSPTSALPLPLVHPRDPPASPPNPPASSRLERDDLTNEPEDLKPVPNPQAPGLTAQGVEIPSAAPSSKSIPESPRRPDPPVRHERDEVPPVIDPEQLGFYPHSAIAYPGKQVSFHSLPIPSPHSVPTASDLPSNPFRPLSTDGIDARFADVFSPIPRDPPSRIPTVDPREPQAPRTEEPTAATDVDDAGSGENEDSGDGETESASDGDQESGGGKLELAISAFASYRNGLVSRYIIKRNGTPIVLGPAPLGRLERLAEATRWWPSKGAMCRTLTSATEEQLEVLAGLLNLPDSNGRSVSRSILRVGKIKERGGPHYRAYSDKNGIWALLAVVEDMVDEQSSFSPSFKGVGRKQKNPETMGQGSAQGKIPGQLPSDRPEVRFQDLSKLSGSRDDFTRRLTTHHIWKIQPFLNTQGTPYTAASAAADWTRCFVTEEHADQEEIARRCAQLEMRIPGGLSTTRRKLTGDQRAQITRLEEDLARDEQRAPPGRQNFAWHVEQLEVVRPANHMGLFETARKKRKQAWDVSAILVFFTRRPADGVDVAELFYTTTTPARGNELPVYTKIARRHLSLETLKTFNIAFEIDPQDPSYFIIKRWVPEEEQDRLWQHTRTIRDRRGVSTPMDIPHQDPDAAPALVRQEDDNYGPSDTLSSVASVGTNGEVPPRLSRLRSRYEPEGAMRRQMELEKRTRHEKDLKAKIQQEEEAKEEAMRREREKRAQHHKTQEEEVRRRKEAEEESRRLKEAEEYAKRRTLLEEEARRRKEVHEATRRQRDVTEEDAKRRRDLEEAAEIRHRYEQEQARRRSELVEAEMRERYQREQAERRKDLDGKITPVFAQTRPVITHNGLRSQMASRASESSRTPGNFLQTTKPAGRGRRGSMSWTDDSDSTAEEDDDIVARLLSQWTPAGVEGAGAHENGKASQGAGRASDADVTADDLPEAHHADPPTRSRDSSRQR